MKRLLLFSVETGILNHFTPAYRGFSSPALFLFLFVSCVCVGLLSCFGTVCHVVYPHWHTIHYVPEADLEMILLT